jgi:dipeptidyl aminopeptidase/acylaminoacyl peptidase
MKRRLPLVGLATVLLTLASAAALFLLGAFGGDSFSDPASARCNHPPVTFGANQARGDHQEIAVHFTCSGAVLAGTLTLPNDARPHPAVVWVHGSGEASRLTYEGAPLVRSLVGAGIAVLSYDKRGVGASQGECCPGDSGHFNLLAADVDGAVNALRSRSDVDSEKIGLLGVSEAGWIVPMAAVRAPVAFTALVDGPTVTHGEEHLYSHLTGEEGGDSSGLSRQEIARRLEDAGPSGFDPTPFLKQLVVPGLWLYGGQDLSQPTAQDVAILNRLKAGGKDFTVIVFPRAGHGLLDVPPTDPRALPTVVEWIRRTVEGRS